MKKPVKNNYNNLHRWLLMTIIFASLFLSIGYAQISNINLGISGTASISETEDVFISDAIINTNSPANIANSNILLTDLTLMQSKVTLNQNRNSNLSMNITIYNNSGNDVYFDNVVYTNEFYDNSNIDYTLNGLSHGQLLETNDSVTFTITFKYSDAYLATNPTVFDDELNSYINFSFKKGYSVTYIGFNSTTGLDTVILEDQTLTEIFNNTTGIPSSVTVSGCTFSYSSPTLTLSNATDNVVVTGTMTSPYVYVLNMYDYVLHGNPISNSITTYNSPAAVMAAFYNQPFYFKHILENNLVAESYIDFIITPEMVQDDGRLTAGTYTLRGGVNESNSANKPVFDANVLTLKQAFGENSGICNFSDPDEAQCYANYSFQASSDGLVSFYIYVDALNDVIFCSIDQDGDSHCVV